MVSGETAPRPAASPLSPGAVAPPMRRQPAQAMGEATPTPGRRRVLAGSRLFSSCPCSPPRAAAHTFPQAAGRFARGIRLRHPFCGPPRGPRGAPIPSRSPSERSPAFRLLRARLLNEVPGFGAVCSLIRLAPLRSWAGGAADPPLGSSSRSPVARLPSPFGDLLAANQWIAETSSVLGVDPEGSESPISPHPLPIEFRPVPV